MITWTNITVRLGDLKPWADNPRLSTKKQAQKILDSWKKFGQTDLVKVSPDLDVYDGHQRLSALLTIHNQDYVIEARQSSRHLTEAERREFVITHHAGAVGSWDWNELSNWQPAELLEWGFDDSLLTNWRLDVASLGNFLESEEAGKGGDADDGVTRAEAEKYQEIWNVKEGDIWQLGRHRLACIDSLEEVAVRGFLGGVSVTYLWADPPYGIDIVAANVSVGGGEAYGIPFGGVKERLGTADGSKPFGSKGSTARGSVGGGKLAKVGKYAPVIGDETIDTAANASSMYLSMFPGAYQVWWGGNYYASCLPNSPSWLVWDKENTGNFADCEMAWTNASSAARIFRHRWNGMLKASEQGQRRVHPTQKPVALAYWAFETKGKANDVIYDPFLGSGISLLAAEQFADNRTVYGVDLAPAYIATTIQRWVDLTGEEPVLIQG